MMKFSILVCDDSTVARKQVVRCLNECVNADIQQAANGADALELLRLQQFDLLCLDLTMPEVDGVQVLERIKAEKIECFVLVISADIQQQMKQKVAQLGAIDFINKPINKSALSEVLHKFGIH
ncbi:response regulator [Pseudoalteromonas sp. S3776]|uniref:Response regulator n=1 Tax=Pseudoalteromonas undina TaxID=43660 RepID=A0ACC6R648_9GAMM|nr:MULTISPECIES: response regulator [unclassified Pseudoalteromonas]KPZ54264.1 Chemotaxis protein CheY [Pseudoalteromonas sp. P1-25]KPZ57081.1 Chemotaxis protein CheY [Pseudoalteromonas sp. P1-13-1a]KPZ57270.1 Chemotaxis protein CheY [Pseudoalteromonas sp. P1-7a]TMO77553.1 response regulator [Pseudoalteromonas sp. S3785]TMO80779.1 response regulator [Pseudoalteromonas sp. S3776]